MKKYLSLIILMVLSLNLFAQEKYPIPVRTSDQKHSRAVSQVWVFIAAGINLSKAQGITPYDYGKSLGKMFAPSWGAGNNFDSYVKGVVFNYESLRNVTDSPIRVIENSDGSVSILQNEKAWHKYLPDGNPYASFNEVFECMKGANEPIADHMGATFRMELKDTLIVTTLKRK
jgi:hypothetical protein